MAYPEDPLGIRIRIAPAADLTEMPDLYTWQDITQDVSFAESRSITIKAGSSDEQQESNSENALVLRNFDSRCVEVDGTPIVVPAERGRGLGMEGRYTTDNPMSDLYPNFDLGIPVEIATDHDGGGYTVQGVMFLGSAEDSWPGQQPSGNYAIVTATMRGLLSRLTQSRDPKSALYRSLWPVGASLRPTDYWPQESTGLATTAQTTWLNMNTAGQPASSSSAFAGSVTGMVGADALPSVVFTSNGSTMVGVYPLTPGSATGNGVSWRVGTVVGGVMPDGDDEVVGVYVRVTSATGDCRLVRVVMYCQRDTGSIVATNSGYDVFVSDSADSTILSGTSFSAFPDGINPFDGVPHYLEIDLSQAAGTITLNVYVDGELIITDTVAASTGLACPAQLSNGQSAAVSFGGDVQDNTGLTLYGGHAYYTNQSSSGTGAGGGNVFGGPAALGYPGEMAHERADRLCVEESVPHAVFDEETRSTVMGPQLVAGLVTLLRECEKADYGILDDHLGYVAFIPATYMYNQSSWFTIDGALRQLKMPFAPVTDDARTANDVIASHSGGGPGYRFSDEAHVALRGRYPKQVTPNVLTDQQDSDQAGWAVHLGTYPGKRYPSVTLDFRQTPDLIEDWLDPPVPLSSALGARITIINPPRQHVPGAIEMQVRGYAMTLTGRRKWTVEHNTIPYLPWEVQEIATGSGNRSRLANGACTLGVARDADDTSWTLVSAVARWIDSATYGAMFPFDVVCNGEQLTITAITGTTLTQTATVTRAVNGVTRSHAVDSVVELWQPAANAL